MAVLVLFAVAALAALFAAILGSQIAHVGRHEDLVELRNIAEAGLNYANGQLTYGLPGADWRPPRDPSRPTQPYRFRCGRGEFTLSVDYGPDPARVQSRFIRIVSTASLRDNPFLRHTVLALKPVLLTDYARFVTDRFSTGHPASLGVAGLELGGETRDGYTFTVSGPVRSNTDLIWYGTSRLELYSSDAVAEGTKRWREVGRSEFSWSPGVLRDDRVEVAGEFRPADLSSTSPEALSLVIDGVTRAANLFAPATELERQDYLAGFPDWVGDRMVPNSWRVLAELPWREWWANYDEPEYRAVPRVSPPDLEAVEPDLQVNRFLALTRDSGAWVKQGEYWVNTGFFGWGWTRYGGIYIDNFADIQYDHDLEKLRRNWVGSVGVHQSVSQTTKGDRRADGTPGPLEGPADWWDKTGRYYAPPGVEIILHGDAPCPYVEIIRDDPKGEAEDPFYWRDPQGNPILISSGEYLYNKELASTAGECTPNIPDMKVSGPRAIFPFPPNGVIYAEGNIRIRGILPPARIKYSDPYQFRGYFGTDYSGDGRSRRFDLTVVSGGTIYIEGDLLTPRSAGLIDDALEGPNGDLLKGSRIALLARDYVCLNTTALNPRPRQMFEVVRDAEDNLAWYNDRYPVYPPGDFPKFDLLQGPRDEDLNSVAGAQAWNGEPLEADPEALEFLYVNVRLGNPTLRSRLSDLRLMVGHSAWYAPGGAAASGPPSAPGSGEDEPAVEVSLQVGQTTVPWEHGAEWYRFLRPDHPALDPSARDESGHWYLWDGEHDYLEFLPNPYQAMVMQDLTSDPVLQYLTGANVLRFRSRVSPVRLYDEDGNVIGWEVSPRELGYLLGPVAVAPPRGEEPLPVTIEALVYAENGSWFVIPGAWFNEDPDEVPPEGASEEELAQWYAEHPTPAYHEPLNVRITFRGAITENRPADIGEVSEWTSKWCGPAGASGPFLTYEYDPLLRWSAVWEGSYLRFRNMPLTADVLVWGERVSGQAGG